MSIDGQNIDYEALRAEQAEQCQALSELECQRVDIEGIQTFVGLGEAGHQTGILERIAERFTDLLPEIKNDFTSANIDNSIATLANHVFDIGKPS